MVAPNPLPRSHRAPLACLGALALCTTLPAQQGESSRRFAFVVHYDARLVRLNEGLLSSVGASIWEPEWSERTPGPWRFGRIKDNGDQPAGAYAGWLYLVTADEHIGDESGPALAGEFLRALEARLGDLLARAPRESAEHRLAVLHAELDECENRMHQLQEDLVRESTELVPNPEWARHREVADRSEAELREVEVSLELIESEMDRENSRALVLERKLLELQEEFRKLQIEQSSLTSKHPDWAALQARSARISLELDQTAEGLARQADVMSTMTAKQRDLTAHAGVLRERLTRSRESLETLQRIVPTTVETTDQKVAGMIRDLEHRAERLRAAADDVEAELRRIMPPRVTPWF